MHNVNKTSTMDCPHYEEGLGSEKDQAIFEGVNGFWQNVAIFGCSF